MGFCRTRVCGSRPGALPSGGPSRSSSFFPRLFLRPVFVPVRGTVPALPVASRCPYGPSSVQAAPRSSTPRAAYPDNHARFLAPLPRVLCHGLLAREKAGRKPPLLPARHRRPAGRPCRAGGRRRKPDSRSCQHLGQQDQQEAAGDDDDVLLSAFGDLVPHDVLRGHVVAVPSVFVDFRQAASEVAFRPG